MWGVLVVCVSAYSQSISSVCTQSDGENGAFMLYIKVGENCRHSSDMLRIKFCMQSKVCVRKFVWAHFHGDLYNYVAKWYDVRLFVRAPVCIYVCVWGLPSKALVCILLITADSHWLKKQNKTKKAKKQVLHIDKPVKCSGRWDNFKKTRTYKDINMERKNNKISHETVHIKNGNIYSFMKTP